MLLLFFVVVVHVFDIVIVVVDPRDLPLKVGPNQVINRQDFVVVVIFLLLIAQPYF